MTNRLASETALFIDNKMDNFYFLFLKKKKEEEEIYMYSWKSHCTLSKR